MKLSEHQLFILEMICPRWGGGYGLYVTDYRLGTFDLIIKEDNKIVLKHHLIDKPYKVIRHKTIKKLWDLRLIEIDEENNRFLITNEGICLMEKLDLRK